MPDCIGWNGLLFFHNARPVCRVTIAGPCLRQLTALPFAGKRLKDSQRQQKDRKRYEFHHQTIEYRAASVRTGSFYTGLHRMQVIVAYETCHHRHCILLPVRAGWRVTQYSLVVVAPGEVESSATHPRGRIPVNSGGLMAEGDNILANNLEESAMFKLMQPKPHFTATSWHLFQS